MSRNFKGSDVITQETLKAASFKWLWSIACWFSTTGSLRLPAFWQFWEGAWYSQSWKWSNSWCAPSRKAPYVAVIIFSSCQILWKQRTGLSSDCKQEKLWKSLMLHQQRVWWEKKQCQDWIVIAEIFLSAQKMKSTNWPFAKPRPLATPVKLYIRIHMRFTRILWLIYHSKFVIFERMSPWFRTKANKSRLLIAASSFRF